jgi:teichuronic acid biosynthesis glycosyltransferase TuaC
MLRVLVLSTLFPDATRPNFGIFVERQTLALAERDDVALQVVAPVGIPPAPLDRLPRYRAIHALPEFEDWKGLQVHRPRFRAYPGTGGRFHARNLVRTLTPLLRRIRRDFPFDVIDAEFFFPDGVAAVELGRRFEVPVSIKARGSDIHYWGRRPATAAQIRQAAHAADGLLSVSEAMRDDMAALGLPGNRTECIVTGVDFERFASGDRAAAKAAVQVDGPLVLSVGALIPLKGHQILIDAIATLPGVRLWIAGEGPHRPQLEAQIMRLGSARRTPDAAHSRRRDGARIRARRARQRLARGARERHAGGDPRCRRRAAGRAERCRRAHRRAHAGSHCGGVGRIIGVGARSLRGPHLGRALHLGCEQRTASRLSDAPRD